MNTSANFISTPNLSVASHTPNDTPLLSITDKRSHDLRPAYHLGLVFSPHRAQPLLDLSVLQEVSSDPCPTSRLG